MKRSGKNESGTWSVSDNKLVLTHYDIKGSITLTKAQVKEGLETGYIKYHNTPADATPSWKNSMEVERGGYETHFLDKGEGEYVVPTEVLKEFVTS